MSALVIPALGLANRAVQALPALFGDLAGRAPADDLATIDSMGHSEPGKGGARYI